MAVIRPSRAPLCRANRKHQRRRQDRGIRPARAADRFRVRLLRWCEANAAPAASAAIASHSVANAAFYLKGKAEPFFRRTLGFVDVVPLDRAATMRALDLPMDDLEDALQAVGAVRFGADYIVTRDLRDFTNSPVPAIPPAGFLALVAPSQSNG